MRFDPFAFSELLEQRAVEAARGAVSTSSTTGALAQPGIAQSLGQALVSAMCGLAVEQQPQPVGVAERAASPEASSSAKA